MSIAFDSFSWWRAEFNDQSNPYQSPAATLMTPSIEPQLAIQRNPIGDQLDSSLTLGDSIYDTFLSYDNLSNWHWPADLTFGDGDTFPLPSRY